MLHNLSVKVEFYWALCNVLTNNASSARCICIKIEKALAFLLEFLVLLKQSLFLEWGGLKKNQASQHCVNFDCKIGWPQCKQHVVEQRNAIERQELC